MNLLPGVADQLGIDEAEGVAVLSVRPRSYAARLRLRPRDVIVSVQERRITSIRDLEQVLAEKPRTWVLGIKRGGRLLTLQVPG